MDSCRKRRRQAGVTGNPERREHNLSIEEDFLSASESESMK
jgi:hypothetical protein